MQFAPCWLYDSVNERMIGVTEQGLWTGSITPCDSGYEGVTDGADSACGRVRSPLAIRGMRA